jgi:uncharacterized membrane protein (Fun14 family)
MVIETTVPTLTGPIVSFTGSTLCGYLIGWILKKILKWVIIIIGVIAGMIFLLIQ